jgi:putative transposase
MQQHTSEFRITFLCRVFCVSRSGFYDWCRRQQRVSLRQAQQQTVDAQVKQAFAARKSRYGAPRLARDLHDHGIACDRKTVARSLQRQGLRAKAARKFKATTNSQHNLPVAPNVLAQNFTAAAPNQKWAGDITYLRTGEGWLYLAVMIDLYSRQVIGWAVSDRMTTNLVSDALRKALWLRKMPQGVIVHSDRGSQYCSHEYQQLFKDHQLVCSMSGKGNCYDNAMVESFFHTLKVEAIHGEHFASRESLKNVLREYIEIDYNRNRRHSALGYISPAQFEAKRVA